MPTADYTIRPIEARDNLQVAAIIRHVMPEFGCVGEGFSIQDPEVDTMFEAFQAPQRAFFVLADTAGQLFGCGGYAPLAGGQYPQVCELQKMYFLPQVRGLGLGWALLQRCIQGATQDGYAQMYLETVSRMEAAAKLYQRAGFEPIDHAMGATGHTGCDRFMIRTLPNPRQTV